MMRRLRIAALMASCGTVVLTPLLVGAFAGSEPPHLEATAAASAADYLPAPAAVTPEPPDAARTPAINKTAGVADAISPTATVTHPKSPAAPVAEPAPIEPPPTAVAMMVPDNSQSASGEMTTASAPDPAQDGSSETQQGLNDPCAGAETCIDEYLWSLYERAPKVDTVKQTEKKEVTVEKNGKSHTITKTETKLVAENFAWKDPQAAEKAGMPIKVYVIGGMDHGASSIDFIARCGRSTVSGLYRASPARSATITVNHWQPACTPRATDHTTAEACAVVTVTGLPPMW